MRHLISLGNRCDVAFNLRMHSGENVAHFFDWLVTPFPSLLQVLERDFDVFYPDDLSLMSGTGHDFVRCRQTDIRFQHQFPYFSGSMRSDFLLFYPAFIGKVRHLAARFKEYANVKPVTFVRRTITEDQATMLETAFFKRFPGADARFLYINHQGNAFKTEFGHSVSMPAPGRGLGSPPRWAAMLKEEGLITEPYRLSTEDVLGKENDTHELAVNDRFDEDELVFACKANPRHPKFFYEAATYYEKRGDLEQALTYAQSAIAIDATNADFLFKQTTLLWKAKKLHLRDALESSGAIAEKLSDFKAQETYTKMLFVAGRMKQVILYCDRLLLQAPLHHALYAIKAESLCKLDEFERAEFAISTAISCHENWVAYRVSHARILAQTGRLEAAITAAETALSMGAGEDCRALYDDLVARREGAIQG